MKLIINQNADDIVLILRRQDLPETKLYPASNKTARAAFNTFITTLRGVVADYCGDDRRAAGSREAMRAYFKLIEKIATDAQNLRDSEAQSNAARGIL